MVLKEFAFISELTQMLKKQMLRSKKKNLLSGYKQASIKSM